VIAVDTSVWVSALRSPSSPGSNVAPFLAALLDADEVVLPVPVRLELLVGVPARERRRLTRLLSALPVAYPTDETWQTLDAWAGKGADAGQRFGVGDLLIAAIAAEQGALLWSLDRDFLRLSRLGFVSLYEP
jgi:predicted nucleic acid-binding protein